MNNGNFVINWNTAYGNSPTDSVSSQYDNDNE